MKSKLAILGAFLVLGLAALLDTPPDNSRVSMYYEIKNEESVDADAQYVQRATSYSYEFLLDEMKEVNENIVETYREYQVNKDSEGNIISKIPTSNYQYLKYKKE